MNKVRMTGILVGLSLAGLAMNAWAAPVNLWTKFNDTNPQNTQDKWLAATIVQLKSEANLEVKNTFAPYDQINAKLNLAVQAGGDVPDVSYIDQLEMLVQNGALTDLTDFVKKAPWFKDITPAALKACTALDGKIYAVPGNIGGSILYYWTSAFPKGGPKTTADLLSAGARHAKDGKFVISFKGSETVGTDMFFFQLVESFGGKYTDAKGNSSFASPQTVKAIEFVRELFAKKYVPEVALAAGFDNETPWVNGNAAAYAAGSWAYVYQNPLTSFDGKTKIDKGASSIEEAIKTGLIAISDPITAPGGKSVSMILPTMWAIPVGSKNVEGAKAFMNFMMQTKNNADYAVAYGGLPAVTSGMKDSRFINSPYWQAVNASINRTGVVPTPNKNQKMRVKFNELVITLVQKPSLNILTELKKLQDELNSGM